MTRFILLLALADAGLMAASRRVGRCWRLSALGTWAGHRRFDAVEVVPPRTTQPWSAHPTSRKEFPAMPTASWANRVRPMGLALVEVLSGVVLALGHRAATRIPMTATHQPSSDHPHAAPRAAVPDKPVARAWAEGAELCRDHAAADVRAFAGQVLAQPTGTGDARYPAGLTARQVEVLRLVAAGHSNREIAATLVLSVRTVERHIENIYTRLGVHGNAARVAVTAIAAHTGLLVAS